MSDDRDRIRELEGDVGTLEQQVKWLRRTLATTLSWIVQSANSPLRKDEAEQLIAMLMVTSDALR